MVGSSIFVYNSHRPRIITNAFNNRRYLLERDLACLNSKLSSQKEQKSGSAPTINNSEFNNLLASLLPSPKKFQFIEFERTIQLSFIHKEENEE